MPGVLVDALPYGLASIGSRPPAAQCSPLLDRHEHTSTIDLAWWCRVRGKALAQVYRHRGSYERSTHSDPTHSPAVEATRSTRLPSHTAWRCSDPTHPACRSDSRDTAAGDRGIWT